MFRPRPLVALLLGCLLTVCLFLPLSCQSRPAAPASLSDKLDSLRLARPELLSCMGAEDSAIVASILWRARENAWGEACVLDSLLPLFLDVPYVGGTLENNDGQGNERLVINLRELDCVTLVENVTALCQLIRLQQGVEAYPYMIALLRYRGGDMGDYTTRLHYTTEWLLDNQRMGLVEDLTPRYSHLPSGHDIHFMTWNADLYPMLVAHPDFVGKMEQIQQRLNEMDTTCFIPKALVREEGIALFPERLAEARESLVTRLSEGDIIMIDTAVEGMDIGHLGFAHYQDGRLHLLHASSSGRRVMVSPEPLCDYLAGIRRFTGIRVVKIK